MVPVVKKLIKEVRLEKKNKFQILFSWSKQKNCLFGCHSWTFHCFPVQLIKTVFKSQIIVCQRICLYIPEEINGKYFPPPPKFHIHTFFWAWRKMSSRMFYETWPRNRNKIVLLNFFQLLFCKKLRKRIPGKERLLVPFDSQERDQPFPSTIFFPVIHKVQQGFRCPSWAHCHKRCNTILIRSAFSNIMKQKCPARNCTLLVE